MSYIPNLHEVFFEAASTGKVRGKTAHVWSILGRRDRGWLNTTDIADLAGYLDSTQSFLNTPTSADTLYLTSTSASDTAAGIGLRTVRITYLDASGNLQVKTATLNGTTNVSLGTGYDFILGLESATAGASNAAVGDVYITRAAGAPTVANTVDMIAAKGGRSMSGSFKIPTGYTGYIARWDACAVGQTMDIRMRAQVFSNDRSLSQQFHFQDTMYLASNQNQVCEVPFLSFPAGCIVKVAAIPGATLASNRCDCSFDLLLIQN